MISGPFLFCQGKSLRRHIGRRLAEAHRHHKILLIGSGPIVIGQACEFDYSGTQACKALREEGYEVVLVNSNPATIMTDPEIADRDLHRAAHARGRSARIIEKERPDALLPTLGGQTGAQHRRRRSPRWASSRSTASR